MDYFCTDKKRKYNPKNIKQFILFTNNIITL